MGLEPSGGFGNFVLDGIGHVAMLAMLPQLRPARFDRGQVIARRGRPLKRALFPVSSIISVEVRAERYRMEVMTIGSEGFAGYWLGLGVEPLDAEIICLVPGVALELPARAFTAAIVQRPELAGVVTEMAHATAAQLMRNVVCSALHSLRQRTARLLVETSLRLGPDLPLTHEEVAAALGATRPSVTREMRLLANDGTIAYRRGKVHVLEAGRLEGATCSCFETLRNRRAHLVARLGGPAPAIAGIAASPSTSRAAPTALAPRARPRSSGP